MQYLRDFLSTTNRETSITAYLYAATIVLLVIGIKIHRSCARCATYLHYWFVLLADKYSAFSREWNFFRTGLIPAHCASPKNIHSGIASISDVIIVVDLVTRSGIFEPCAPVIGLSAIPRLCHSDLIFNTISPGWYACFTIEYALNTLASSNCDCGVHFHGYFEGNYTNLSLFVFSFIHSEMARTIDKRNECESRMTRRIFRKAMFLRFWIARDISRRARISSAKIFRWRNALCGYVAFPAASLDVDGLTREVNKGPSPMAK